MAKVKIQGHASGTGVLTVTAPNTSTDRTITLPDGTGTLIADDGSGNVNIGTTGTTAKLEVQKSGVVNAQISNATNGHYFVSQSDDNTDGFEIYQQHGTNTTRNNFIVNDNRTGSKSSAFRVRNDGLTIHGGGLTFNGETATANTLDDYEEGSGNSSQIAVKLGGTALTVTGSGYRYVKIGNAVHFNFEFRITNLNGASGGSFTIGLPFSNALFSTGAIRIYDGAVDGNEFIGVDSNDSVCYIARRVNNSGVANVTATNNAYYFGQLTYTAS